MKDLNTPDQTPTKYKNHTRYCREPKCFGVSCFDCMFYKTNESQFKYQLKEKNNV